VSHIAGHISELDFETYCDQSAPVFVFGAARSGTTLTYRVMDFHQAVFMMPRDTYFVPHYWNIRHQVPRKALHKMLLWVGQGPDLVEGSECRKDLYQKLLRLMEDDDPRKIFSFVSYLSYMQQKVKKDTSVTWWAERTNSHSYAFETLKKWYPTCKFIFCIRDPRAVIASALGAQKKNGTYPSSVSGYCLNAAISWAGRNRLIGQIQRQYPNDIFVSRYEDLVSKPIEHINHLWQFLDLPVLNETDLRLKIDDLGPIYQSKTGVNRVSGIDTRSIERWRDLLSDEQVAIIEDTTWQVAKNLGYILSEARTLSKIYLHRFKGEHRLYYIKRLMKLLAYKTAPELFFAFQKKLTACRLWFGKTTNLFRV